MARAFTLHVKECQVPMGVLFDERLLRKRDMGEVGLAEQLRVGSRLVAFLFILGMTERIADLADASHDRTGLDLESENLPKRISSPRKERDGRAN